MQETQEMWAWSLGWENPLEKGRATHSSILAWRIPWTEEPGGLQSMGSQRVGHSWASEHMHSRHMEYDINRKNSWINSPKVNASRSRKEFWAASLELALNDKMCAFMSSTYLPNQHSEHRPPLLPCPSVTLESGCSIHLVPVWRIHGAEP